MITVYTYLHMYVYSWIITAIKFPHISWVMYFICLWNHKIKRIFHSLTFITKMTDDNWATHFFPASYQVLGSVIYYVLFNINATTQTQARWTKGLLLLSALLWVYKLSRITTTCVYLRWQENHIQYTISNWLTSSVKSLLEQWCIDSFTLLQHVITRNKVQFQEYALPKDGKTSCLCTWKIGTFYQNTKSVDNHQRNHTINSKQR